jgi:arylsulfatase A-like enzyme
VHTYEVHTPYLRGEFTRGLERGRLGTTLEVEDPGLLERIQPDAAELEYVRALYDGGVATADREVGALLAVLEELGLDARTLVVLTSDHGEDLGDRTPLKPATHGHSLYDELVHIPLIVRDPDAEAGLRIPQQVRLVDVMPTVLDRLGVALDSDLDGQSLASWSRPEERHERPAFARLTTHRFVVSKESLRTGRHKLIRNAFPAQLPLELYDLEADPGETHNLADAEPALRERLKAELDGVRSRVVEEGAADYRPDEMSDALRERLEALGYAE